MLNNYLKIAFRNIWKHKVYSLINILGLAIGMAAVLLITLYVRFELSYDNFHGKADRTYRMVTDVQTGTETINASITSWAYAPHIAKDFPEVEEVVRISGTSLLVRKENESFQENQCLFADVSFFRIFDFKLLKGSTETALNIPFSIVLTETTAKKYFGTTDPLGKTVLLGTEGEVATITGVMKDMPENSQIKADLLISMTTLTKKIRPDLEGQWGNFGAVTYLLLKPETQGAGLEKKFPAFLEKYAGKMMAENKMYYKLTLESLRNVYLRSDRDGAVKGSLSNIWAFTAVGFFILLIASINFVNLTTARSAERAKEVGVRKVVGAPRSLLARQFLIESVILCLVAYLLAILLVSASIPAFNDLAGKKISSGLNTEYAAISLLFLMAIIIGLLAGLYPALVLASFQPIKVLKGRFTTSNKGIMLRKGLVTVQFAISIALMIATTIVYLQMHYMRDRDLGFEKNQMLVIDTDGDPNKLAFMEAIRGMPGVKSTSSASSVPGGDNSSAHTEMENKSGDLQVSNLALYMVDFDYISQYKLQIVAGRAFDRSFGTDTTQAMIINETASRLLGYATPDEAIGRRFKQWGREGKVIGVIKDFHFKSLQETISPLTMRIELNNCDLVSVQIAGADLPATLSSLADQWKQTIPNRPFQYNFMDEFFDRQYRSEERFEMLFFSFAMLAILIACLGLVGLSSYSTQQRTKEIGIRKVMGASVASIVQLLFKDFFQLVIIAFVIAAPVAYYYMQQWLQRFAYKTDIPIGLFIVAGVAALLIAFLTVGFQSIRAGMMNPVKSLKSE